MLSGELGTFRWRVTTDEVIWSPAVYTLLALSPERRAPSMQALLERLEVDDAARVAAGFGQVKANGTPFGLDARIARAVSPSRIVRLRVWRDERDHADIHGTIEDVSDALRDAISDRVASIGTFAAALAQEISNPLGLIEATLATIVAADAPAAALRDARHAIARIETTIRGLLTFSRVDPSRREPLDVNRLVDVAAELLDRDIRRCAKLVRKRGAVPLVHGNGARLSLAIVNLVQNAVQAMAASPSGAHELTLTTRTDARGRAVLEVRDTGHGVPPEVLPHIFDAFFTTRAGASHAGLGLAVCRNVANELEGELTFESVPARGALFRIAVPPNPLAAAPERRAPVIASARRGNVLIVDDEVTFANAVRRVLAREHEVSIAHDGQAALDRITAGERFDAIVCDLMMPRLGGSELYDRLSDLLPEQAQRMIFMTGAAYGASSEAFFARVTNPWLEKPCDMDQLRTAVRRLVT